MQLREISRLRYFLRRRIYLSALIGALVGCASQQSIDSKFDVFERFGRATYQLNISENQKVNAIEKEYEKLFFNHISPQDLQDTKRADLDLLFRGASNAVFYTSNPKYIPTMQLVVEELQRRQLADEQHFKGIYKALIQTRMLHEATLWFAKFPIASNELPPEFSDNTSFTKGQPSEWLVSIDQRIMTRRVVDLNILDTKIIVVSHPGCYFSRNAVKDIYADPALSKRLDRRVRWLAPQDGNLNFDKFQDWNRNNPEAQLSMAHKSKEWEAIDSWATPTFYFFSGGKVVTKFSGWRGKNSKEQLVAALESIGL